MVIFPPVFPVVDDTTAICLLGDILCSILFRVDDDRYYLIDGY